MNCQPKSSLALDQFTTFAGAACGDSGTDPTAGTSTGVTLNPTVVTGETTNDSTSTPTSVDDRATSTAMVLHACNRDRAEGRIAPLAVSVLVYDRQLSCASGGGPRMVGFDKGVKIGLRITRPVVVSDIDMLPAKLVRVKTTREPDKVAIGKLLKAGEVVSGARLGVNETVDWGR